MELAMRTWRQPFGDAKRKATAGPQATARTERVRGPVCRQIVAGDLPAIVDLLIEAFPERSTAYWRDAMRRFADYAAPGGVPRFGYALAVGDAVVGVLLLIHSVDPDGHGLRGNLSSWYVRPDYRAYAPLLNLRAIRDERVTYVNISPALETVRTIKTLGFVKASSGLFVGIPALARQRRDVRIHQLRATRDRVASMTPQDQQLMSDHIGFGCLAFWADTGAGGVPFIFRRRVLRGILPCAMLIHAGSLEALEALAGALGRILARQGMPVMAACADRPLRGVPGMRLAAKWPIYYRGVLKRAAFDLAYTEAAMFGA